MTPSNHFNPNASSTQMKYQSPIPLEIENYSNSQFLIGSKNRNPTSIKTCKNIVSNSQNSSEMQPYFKFRSKSCEKHKKEEKYFIKNNLIFEKNS